MALVDDPFVELVPKIANRRQSDLLKSILGEERRERPNSEDNQQDREDSLPLVRLIRVPPGVESPLRTVEGVDQQAAFSFALVPLEHDVEDPSLGRAVLAADLRGRAGQHLVEERLAQRDHHRLTDREDDHRAEGDDGPDAVLIDVAVEPLEDTHDFTMLIIASATRRLAPGPPSFCVTAASSATTAACRAGSMSARTSLAMRSPL